MLRTHLSLTHISANWNTGEEPGTPYLWTAFFKVDGSTISVVGVGLSGQVTVAGTPGNQGDLGNSPGDQYGGSWDIAAEDGSYVTNLQSITAPIIGQIPGFIGFVAIILDWANTPASAVAAGHSALNSALQAGIDQLLSTLGPMNQTITPAEIASITTAITNAVVNATLSALNDWQKFVLATVNTPDYELAQFVQMFSQQQLLASPPAGLPINQTYTATGPVGPQGSHSGKTQVLQTWSLQGKIVADPYPISLQRVLTGIGHPPAVGLRSLCGPGNVSILNWVGSVR